jgi:hypothetical protein
VKFTVISVASPTLESLLCCWKAGLAELQGHEVNTCQNKGYANHRIPKINEYFEHNMYSHSVNIFSYLFRLCYSFLSHKFLL